VSVLVTETGSMVIAPHLHQIGLFELLTELRRDPEEAPIPTLNARSSPRSR
jgi:hypothetical protein